MNKNSPYPPLLTGHAKCGYLFRQWFGYGDNFLSNHINRYGCHTPKCSAWHQDCAAAELLLAASHIEFVIHRIKEHDADDASSGVCTDGAADGRFYQLLWGNSLQQKVFGILQGIGIFPVADAHDLTGRVCNVFLCIFDQGF